MSQAPTPPRPRLVTCPACRGDSVYSAENPFRPFCSERCKNVDFGAWAAEGYRLDATPQQSAREDDDSKS